MILTVLVCLKDIVEQGRDFPWPRPEKCPQCHGNRVWGHGFVGAIFDGCSELVLLRRFRCPDCRCVLRLRPDGYFKRFQASVSTIRTRVAHRLRTGRWLDGMSRSRQGYWLSNLKKRVIAHKGLDRINQLIQSFDALIREGKIPVSGLEQCVLLKRAQ